MALLYSSSELLLYTRQFSFRRGGGIQKFERVICHVYGKHTLETFNYCVISIESVILSPCRIPSFFRTSALSGKIYAPSRLSKKIEVFHFDFPKVTETGNEFHPRRFPANFLSISADCFLESEAKCQFPCIPG